MTNFRVLHSSSKGFWGRLRCSCPLPAPPELWKQQQAQHPYKLYHHFQVLGCFLWEQLTPWDALIPFLCFHTSPDTQSNVSTPRTHSCPPGGCLDTQHNLHSLTAAWKTNVTETSCCRHSDKAMINFFFSYFTGIFSKIFACLTRLW